MLCVVVLEHSMLQRGGSAGAASSPAERLLLFVTCNPSDLFVAPYPALQHLWTGPISNAPVEIIQGGRSVEVRPVGVTKGLAMQRILGYMASICGMEVGTERTGGGGVLFNTGLCGGSGSALCNSCMIHQCIAPRACVDLACRLSDCTVMQRISHLQANESNMTFKLVSNSFKPSHTRDLFATVGCCFRLCAVHRPPVGAR